MARSKTDLKNIPRTQKFRKTGKMIGWKKAYAKDTSATVLVKLEIPSHALRICGKYHTSADLMNNWDRDGLNNEKKCRASEAKVLGIWHRHKDANRFKRNSPILGRRVTKAVSTYIYSFEYRVGKTVTPIRDFDTRDIACGSGIHFFMSARQAANY